MKNQKRINTNTKNFRKKVQQYVLNYMVDNNDVDVLKNQLKHYKNIFKAFNFYDVGIRLVEGGVLACYYSSVAEDMAQFFDFTIEDIWSYYNDDASKLWTSYKNIIASNINAIMSNRCYI